MQRTRQPILFRSLAEFRAAGGQVLPGTDEPLSLVTVPIVVGDRMLGSILLENYEREQAYGEADLRVLTTIAATMGVALENARLFDETQRRERESTALSEVGRDLSSTLDLATVMDRIASHARELLAAQSSAIFLPDSESGKFRAFVALGDLAEALAATTIEPGQGIVGSLLRSGQAEFINNSAADPRAVQIPDTHMRSDERLMVVPLLAGEAVLGAMAVWRSGGSPFEARDLAFLEGLSRQATIALQNARLFDETKEALERQTATAEVLQVIGSSMADPKPVFEKIVECCERLFDARTFGVGIVGDDGQLSMEVIRMTASARAEIGGDKADAIVARTLAAFPRPLAGTLTEKAIRKGDLVEIHDLENDPDRLQPAALAAGEIGLGTSVVVAPLLWQGRGIGSLTMFRRDSRGLRSKENALLKSFADQAVIAIQNARLFNETQEALAHQTASADILRVISRSPADVQPVFDAIVTTAVRHLGCDIAIVQICSGDTYSPKAMATPAGLTPVPGSTVMPVDPDANFPSRAIVSKTMLHVRDWSAVELPAHEQARHEQLGLNSTLYLPLLRGDACVGVLVLGSKRANGFNDMAIALAESFRDQAVIAIENVRLFNETKVALERQTATAEILAVIADSPDDVQPVLDAIVDSAKRLIGDASATASGSSTAWCTCAAFTATDEAGTAALRASFPAPLSSFHGFEPLRSGRVIQVEDTETDPQVTGEWRDLARRRHYRANVNVPMLRDGAPIGMISVTRTEPGPLRRITSTCSRPSPPRP